MKAKQEWIRNQSVFDVLLVHTVCFKVIAYLFHVFF